MNTPRPTVKNLRSGLIAISYNRSRSKESVEALRLLLNLVWPSAVNELANGKAKYYFQDSHTDLWDCSNDKPDIPAYSLTVFLEAELPMLKQVKKIAYAEVWNKKREYTEAFAVYKKAEDDLECAFSYISKKENNKAMSMLLKENPEIFKQINKVVEALSNDNQTIQEFCNNLTKIQNLLKQTS